MRESLLQFDIAYDREVVAVVALLPRTRIGECLVDLNIDIRRYVKEVDLRTAVYPVVAAVFRFIGTRRHLSSYRRISKNGSGLV